MRDTYGDIARVSRHLNKVYLDTRQGSPESGSEVELAFTPKQARRLARKLKKAARAAESEV